MDKDLYIANAERNLLEKRRSNIKGHIDLLTARISDPRIDMDMYRSLKQDLIQLHNVLNKIDLELCM